MSEKELSQYYFYKKEIKDIEYRIAELGYGVGSIKYTNEPKSTLRAASIQEKITELKDILIEKRISALEAYLNIESFIGNIDESEMRLIARYRFLDCLTWEQIAAKLGNGQDRTSVSKKFRKFIANSHISHIDVLK